MKDKIFLDSNIFLYAFSSKDMPKHNLAKELVLRDAIISVQVINEVTVNLIKKFKMTENEIEKFIQSSYERYQFIILDKETFLMASSLRKKYMFSYFDSVIVAAALIANCSILYSEDMQHELIIDNRLKIINPFK